jgi:hypothetical protein
MNADERGSKTKALAYLDQRSSAFISGQKGFFSFLLKNRPGDWVSDRIP